MRVVRAETDAMREKIYRFRYKIFCEEIHMLDPDDYPDGRECDRYDVFAEQYAFIDEAGKIVGSFRFVRQNPVGFPGLDHMGMRSLQEEYGERSLGEISRIAISKPYRSIENTMTLLKLLVKYGCPYLKQNGIEFVFCAVEASLFRLLKMAGFPFERKGEGRIYFGKRRWIAMMDMKRYSKSHPRLCKF